MYFQVATQNELWKVQKRGRVYKGKKHKMQFLMHMKSCELGLQGLITSSMQTRETKTTRGSP